jgi:hypothetical protein
LWLVVVAIPELRLYLEQGQYAHRLTPCGSLSLALGGLLASLSRPLKIRSYASRYFAMSVGLCLEPLPITILPQDAAKV